LIPINRRPKAAPDHRVMEPQIVEFRTDKRFIRRAREHRTLETMIGMYCRHTHFANTTCRECTDLSAYAERRLERCVFGDEKPTCANCLVHCYRDDMREKVREVMRWAGPRMLLQHPVMAVMHVLDGRRPTPLLPGRSTAD
jgi:hypothetical protein